MPETSYVCSLSEKSIKKAKKELNEDPKERNGAVQTLKEWIEREPWLHAPTDPCFLLSFLRWGKFSQLRARERLANFIGSCADGKYTFMKGVDPCDPHNLDIFREGINLVLPGTDKEGRLVILSRIGAVDLSRRSLEDYSKAEVPLFKSILFFNEEAQVNGMTFLIDYGGVSLKMMTPASANHIKRKAEFTNKCYPGRIKGFHFYNAGPVFEAGMALFKPLLSEKLRQRVKVHHTMLSIYDLIDPSNLPEEYLPDDYEGPTAGTIKSIAEKNIQEYFLEPKKQQFLKDLYSGKYGADSKKKPEGTETMASFRKLNIS